MDYFNTSEMTWQSRTRKREIRAIQDMPIKIALILSETNEKDIAVNGAAVKIQSIPEWLLRQPPGIWRFWLRAIL